MAVISPPADVKPEMTGGLFPKSGCCFRFSGFKQLDCAEKDVYPTDLSTGFPVQILEIRHLELRHGDDEPAGGREARDDRVRHKVHHEAQQRPKKHLPGMLFTSCAPSTAPFRVCFGGLIVLF